MKSLPYVHDTIKVTQEMCDHNGHMNVNYYYKLFDSVYTSFYIDELGVTADELSDAQKNKLSHRANAMRAATDYLVRKT